MTQLGNGVGRGLLDVVFGKQADYVRSLFPAFAISLFVFGFSLVAGYSFGGEASMAILDLYLEQLPADMPEWDFTQYFVFIDNNNVTNGFLWIALGFVLSIPPLYFSAINGFVVGSISHYMVVEQSLGYTLVGLLPHGIIEIPTLLLCAASGMSLGYSLINRLRGKGSLQAEAFRALRLFVTRILPLIVLAAVREVTVTPTLLGVFGFF